MQKSNDEMTRQSKTIQNANRQQIKTVPARDLNFP